MEENKNEYVSNQRICFSDFVCTRNTARILRRTNDEAKKYITKITKGINTNKQEILEKIKKYLKPEWKLDRLSKINLVILKLAIYELNYTDTPFKVVINEAVELSKKYGDDTSSVFVNGILASVVGENLDENRTNNS